MIRITRVKGESSTPIDIRINTHNLKDDTYKLENILLKSGSGTVMRIQDIEFTLRTINLAKVTEEE